MKIFDENPSGTCLHALRIGTPSGVSIISRDFQKFSGIFLEGKFFFENLSNFFFRKRKIPHVRDSCGKSKPPKNSRPFM